MTPITAIVADDEAVARRRLVRMLEESGRASVVAACAGGREAVERVVALKPDLLFLDVQMPDLDGFQVVEAITGDGRASPAIVFVTAYDQYALRAFDVHAVDYLLKPFTGERFRTALARARERIASHAPDPALAGLAADLRRRPAYLTRLPVRSGGRTVFVDLESVDWLEAADNYVRVHVQRREHLVRETLAALDAQLDPDRFARIHRSVIVNVARIAEVRPTSHGDAEVLLRDGARLAVSRTWRHRLQP
jgi:two-component system LytT family response regulator